MNRISSRGFSILFCTLIFLLIFSNFLSSAHAQVGTIECTVNYVDSGFLVTCEAYRGITLEAGAGGVGSGTFYIYNLDPDIYTVECWAQGYVPQSLIASVESGGTETLTFNMVEGWPMFHQDRWHTGHSPATGPKLPFKIKWSYQTGSSVDSSPAVVDGVVYAASYNGRVYALNSGTGAFQWSYIAQEQIIVSPAVVDGVVYVGSNDNTIYALDATSDGALVWSYAAGDNVDSSPAVVNGLLYVGSHDNNVYALSASDGGFVWSYYTTGGYSGSSPSVVNGVVYVGSTDQNVYALNASDGNFRWSYPTQSFVYSSPAVVGSKVYVGSYDNNIYALDASDGTFLWSYPTQGFILSSPAVGGSKAYVGSYDNTIYALDVTSNGALVWSYSAGHDFVSSPMVADGIVYVGSSNGKFYALNESTGNPLWNYTARDNVDSSPAVVNGMAYVGSADNNVYAFETAVPTAEGISPSEGVSGTTVLATIEGYFFDGSSAQAPTVKLLKGSSTIEGTVTSWEGESITCSFDLTGAAVGAWDLTVINNPNGKSGTWAGVFDVYIPSPLNFVGTAETTTSIIWGWQDVEGELEYRIYSSLHELKGTVGAGVTTFEETGLLTNEVYTRYVKASSEAGESGPSNSDTKYTLAKPPTGLITTEVIAESITISWEANGNPGWTHYGIERALDSTGPWTTIEAYEDNITSTSYQDTGLDSGIRYWYQVLAYNEDQIPTTYSNKASGITPIPGSISCTVYNVESGFLVTCEAYRGVTVDGGAGGRAGGTGTDIYIISGLAPVTYTVECWAQGYLPTLEVVTVPSGGTAYLAFDMVAGWPMFHQDRWHSGNSLATKLKPPLKLKWSYPTGSIVQSSPAVVNGVVYVGSADNNVYALNASTGDFKWSYTAGDVVDSSPAVVDGTVYVGSYGGKVHALNASTGGLKWVYTTGLWGSCSPAAVNGIVYMGTNNMYALNASDGDLLWSHPTGVIYSSPAVVNEVVYIGSSNSNVYAINASTGDFKWSYTTGFAIQDSAPAVVDGTVYVGSRDYRFYALDAETGDLKWSYLAGYDVNSTPAVVDDTVYVGSGTGLYAFDAEIGNVKWSYPPAIFDSSPAVANGVVYVGSWNKKVYAFNADNGNPLWNYTTVGFVNSSPAVVDEVVYVGSNDTNVYAFEIAVPTPESITPTQEVVGVTVLAEIKGYFHDGEASIPPTVKLTREGYSDINGSVITWEGASITCSFDLPEAAKGYWNVTVINSPNGESGTLMNGFEVVFESSISGVVTLTGGDTTTVVVIEAFLERTLRGSDTTPPGGGSYTISKLIPGTYYVEASAPGYEQKIQSNVIVTEGNVTTVNFSLNPAWPMFHQDRWHTGSSPDTKLSPPLRLKWTYETGNIVPASPAIVGGVVYIGSYDRRVYALDAESGAFQWSYTTGNNVYSSPAVVDGKVYVGSRDSNVYALDATSDGAFLWSYRSGFEIGSSSPAIVNGVVYVGSYDPRLYALDARNNGALLWSYQPPTGQYLNSSPAVVDGIVYAGSGPYVYTLNAGDGALLWSYNTVGGGVAASSPVVVDGVVYVGTAIDGKVYALSAGASGGAFLWSYLTGAPVYNSSPAVVDGVLYIGSQDNNVYALSAGASGGALLWSYPTGYWVDSSPAVVNGVVYIGSQDNNIYALSGGAPLWSYATGDWVSPSSPAVLDGKIYIGSRDNKVYAFETAVPTLESITPIAGVAGETVLATIEGDFYDGACSVTPNAKLTIGGYVTINGNVITYSTNEVICQFNLWGATGGIYDVVVTNNPSGRSGTLKEKFTVTGAGPAQMIGPVLSYPSPFKPLKGQTAYLSYTLSADANVTVYMYDIAGKIIKTWKRFAGSEGGKMGYNHIEWDGATDFGSTVGNGIYVYKIISGGKVIGTGKLVVYD